MIRAAKFSVGVSNKPPHHHDCHQLLYITEGEVKIEINNTEFIAPKDSLIILSRLEKHSISVLSKKYERFELRIDPDVVTKYADSYLYSVLINRPNGFKHIVNAQNPDIVFFFKKIIEEHNSENNYKESMLEMLFKQLLICIYRIDPELFSFEYEKADLVKVIQNYLEENMDQPFNLDELSQKYHLSKYYLSHVFKSVTGYPIIGYLQSLRIAESKRLLTKTDMTINEIIEHCGFSDNSNFSRTFKFYTNLTPSEFRKKYSIK